MLAKWTRSPPWPKPFAEQREQSWNTRSTRQYSCCQWCEISQTYDKQFLSGRSDRPECPRPSRFRASTKNCYHSLCSPSNLHVQWTWYLLQLDVYPNASVFPNFAYSLPWCDSVHTPVAHTDIQWDIDALSSDVSRDHLYPFDLSDISGSGNPAFLHALACLRSELNSTNGRWLLSLWILHCEASIRLTACHTD